MNENWFKIVVGIFLELVVAQLAEWSLLISEDPGLDRVIDILLYTVEKLQIKKKSIFWYFYN